MGKPWVLGSPAKWWQATQDLLCGSQVKATGENAKTELWNVELGLRSRLSRQVRNVLIENINTHAILTETKVKV